MESLLRVSTIMTAMFGKSTVLPKELGINKFHRKDRLWKIAFSRANMGIRQYEEVDPWYNLEL